MAQGEPGGQRWRFRATGAREARTVPATPRAATLRRSTPLPRYQSEPVDLAGLALPDSRSGHRMDLGALRGVHVLTLVRHRY